MRKILNTMLLLTALVCCTNSYSLDSNGYYNNNENQTNIVVWDLYEKENILDLDLLGTFGENDMLLLIDNTPNTLEKYTKLLIKGSNKYFEGFIMVTPEIKEVTFSSEDLFVKIINPDGSPFDNIKFFTNDNAYNTLYGNLNILVDEINIEFPTLCIGKINIGPSNIKYSVFPTQK